MDAFPLEIEDVEAYIQDDDSVADVSSSQLPQQQPVQVTQATLPIPVQRDENSAPKAKRKVVGRKNRNSKVVAPSGPTITTTTTISAGDMSILMRAMDESVLIPSTPAGAGGGREQRESGMLSAAKVHNLMAVLDESVMVPSTPRHDETGDDDDDAGVPLKDLMDAMNTTATQTTPASDTKQLQRKQVVLLEPAAASHQLQTSMSIADFERLVSRLDESTEQVNVSVVHPDESAFFNVAEFDKLFRAVDTETSMRASIYDACVAENGRKSSCLITERPEEQDLLAVFKH